MNRRLRKPQQAATRAYVLSYVSHVSSRDLEPRSPTPLVDKIDSALAVLIIIGIAYGAYWLVSSLASSYIGFFT